ncbi:uncharacterized protein LOC112683737 [Sipha flava]|uniref:Uncharacterized protein LOC112683737 n=1 Tax=Sipha flava TaxID=143950 RepID=A0A8B8FIF3_9HEMI|nr:uncharacterized protein LOC112683737 [Sipha flava]
MRRPMTISGDLIDETENFKYLGSFVQNNGGFYMDVKHMIECDWMKWREALGILYNKRIPIRLKIDRRIEQNMSAAKLRMLRWMSEVTREDRIRNEYVRDSIGIASVVDKIK